MLNFIPPGTRFASNRKSQINPYSEDAFFRQPESLQDRIEREKREDGMKARINAEFDKLDLNHDNQLEWDEFQKFLTDKVSLIFKLIREGL
jgi:hypothetical protein